MSWWFVYSPLPPPFLLSLNATHDITLATHTHAHTHVRCTAVQPLLLHTCVLRLLCDATLLLHLERSALFILFFFVMGEKLYFFSRLGAIKTVGGERLVFGGGGGGREKSVADSRLAKKGVFFIFIFPREKGKTLPHSVIARVRLFRSSPQTPHTKHKTWLPWLP